MRLGAWVWRRGSEDLKLTYLKLTYLLAHCRLASLSVLDGSQRKPARVGGWDNRMSGGKGWRIKIC